MQYPWTVIAYRYGKRVYYDYVSVEDTLGAMEEAVEYMLYAPTHVILPTGEVQTREEFKTLNKNEGI